MLANTLPRRGLAFALLLLLPALGQAQREARVPDPDPELERKTFQVPEGFEVNLYAADPMLMKPIQMNFDPQGRLWVACSEAYPQIKPGQKQNDKVIILEDRNGDGKADKTTVFADGLLIPTGLEPGDGGVYVADSTDILHLADTDGDGKADRRRVILSGFGTEDTHHLIHTFRWGNDGLLYFNQSIYIHSHVETPHGVRRLNAGGIWAFRPETRRLEVFARGWVNAWGHHFDRYGQSFVTDGAGGEGINFVVPGASYPTAEGAARVLNGLNPGSPKYCGLEVVSGRHLPNDWQGNLITNDFRGHRVCRFVLREDQSGYASREVGELIRSTHPAFRPIDVKMGPDGAIYIADWYNPIIQHGEVDFRDPRRDTTHGRIWRITAKGRPLVPRPKLVDASTKDLLDALKEPEDWTRHMARRVLRERGAKAVEPELRRWVSALDASKPEQETLLLEGLWTYQALNLVEPRLLDTLLHAKDGRIRAAAVRVATAWSEQLDVLDRLTARITDEHPRTRLETVRGLSAIASARAAEAALTALERPMDKWLDYALWLTTRELQPRWLPAMQRGEINFGGNVQHLTFALQATGSSAAVGPLVELVRDSKVPLDREEKVLGLIAALGTPQDLSLILDMVGRDDTPADRKVVLLDGLAQAVRQRKSRPAGDLNRLLPLLAARDDAVLASASRLAGLWQLESQRKRLNEIALLANTLPGPRQAALEALIALGGKESIETIRTLASERYPPNIRAQAVIALSELDVIGAAKRGAEVLTKSPGDFDPSNLINALLRQKDGAPALARALGESKVPTDVAKVALRTARASGREVTALADALTKAGGLTNPVRTLSPAAMQALIAEVASKGDAARGEAIYRRKDQACATCHAIGDAGGQVGPNLLSIGASAQMDYLIEALLLPNKAIKEGYHTVSVTTGKGKIITGIKLRQANKALILRSAEDRELTIPESDIEVVENAASLMPEGLTDTLTRGELVDLVRFLSELGKVGPYQLGKERLFRRWQVLEPTSEAYRQLSRVGVGVVARDAGWQTWNPVYSRVDGHLPLSELPTFTLRRQLERNNVLLNVVRGQLEVTTPGKIRLRLGSVEGLRLWLNGTPVELTPETILDLPTGMHTLTWVVDRSVRKESLRIEVADSQESPAQVRVVGGK